MINLFEQDPQEFDKKAKDLSKYSVTLRWGLNHGIWVFGGKSPADFLNKMKSYNYEDVIHQLRQIEILCNN